MFILCLQAGKTFCFAAGCPRAQDCGLLLEPPRCSTIRLHIDIKFSVGAVLKSLGMVALGEYASRSSTTSRQNDLEVSNRLRR
jgi:hypothetical protein